MLHFSGALDSGVPFLDEHDGSTGSKQLPTQSDMIICFPTQAGEGQNCPMLRRLIGQQINLQNFFKFFFYLFACEQLTNKEKIHIFILVFKFEFFAVSFYMTLLLEEIKLIPKMAMTI